MLIYKITNTVNGKVYIGQTVRSLDVRFQEHLRCADNGDGYYLHAAIRKYGKDNFEISTIAETDDPDILNELEIYYIRKFHSDISGYNLAPGGHINCMACPSIKEHHDAIMRSDEVRKKISNSMKARIAENGGLSEDHKRHVSEGLKRFYASGKRPNYKVPQHLTPEHYRALNDAKNKCVYCIDEDGIFVKSFPRVKDAAKWWYDNGYIVKSYEQLCDRIKLSYVEDKYIRGLKWIYGEPCVEGIES